MQNHEVITLLQFAQNEGYRIINHLLWAKGMNDCKPSQEELSQYITILAAAGYRTEKTGE